jgi:hypothetical protein
MIVSDSIRMYQAANRIGWYHPIMTERDEKMTEQTLLRYTPSLGKLIDAWRREQLDGPSRADAMRRLLAIALRAESVEKGEKPAKGRKG